MTQETAAVTTMRNKIIQRAKDAVNPIDRYMTEAQWPAELRAIIWGAVLLEVQARMRAESPESREGKES